MSAKPILYSYFRSSCTWRVRAALALKGIEYEYHPVHLVKGGGEQHSDDYKKVNPVGQIPALVIDGHTLTESLAIVEYLDETRPDPPLLPKNDPYKRALVREVSLIITSGIQPLQNLRVLQHVGSEKKMEWGKYWIDRGLGSLEKLLETTSGKYCVGDEITMADLCLVPQVYNANRFSVDMSKYPIISRINEALSQVDAFKESHPSQQPDCPEDMK
ncbi:maleylacetoacetate isomerase [Exaiptasia diaphana]|uniref:Maleylacetoacetate isomerase n=1 Tax=Exaiptasia diaphana TaxID=2652724 RepID=A0A913X0F4_EXADI|nr:maleylacetoacetate isomerase [Exaiptasia diaphana]KXJ29940.1 putative maleylacetoacetate isomerase 2 [Exaiptasia diaphana]